MFRIKICYDVKDNWIRARLSSNGLYKYIYVNGESYYIDSEEEHWLEFRYQLIKKGVELIRDLLYKKYGPHWRIHEQRGMVYRSAASAVKRMKPAKINRQ